MIELNLRNINRNRNNKIKAGWINFQPASLKIKNNKNYKYDSKSKLNFRFIIFIYKKGDTTFTSNTSQTEIKGKNIK